MLILYEDRCVGEPPPQGFGEPATPSRAFALVHELLASGCLEETRC